jgi:hypothetical protein
MQKGRAEIGGLGLTYLSAGDVTATLVVRVTEGTSLLLCPSKIFIWGNYNVCMLNLVMEQYMEQ